MGCERKGIHDWAVILAALLGSSLLTQTAAGQQHVRPSQSPIKAESDATSKNLPNVKNPPQQANNVNTQGVPVVQRPASGIYPFFLGFVLGVGTTVIAGGLAWFTFSGQQILAQIGLNQQAPSETSASNTLENNTSSEAYEEEEDEYYEEDFEEEPEATVADVDGDANSDVNLLIEQMNDRNSRLQKRIQQAESDLRKQQVEVSNYVTEARTDALTRLPNRRAFDEHLDRQLAIWRRYARPISLILIDIDKFKKFNDDFGHQAGDEVLRQVGRTLHRQMRETDIATRYGGEEFAIILPDTSVYEASIAAERARTALERASFDFNGDTFRVTISCGIAQALPNESAEELIERSDAALYAAKDGGRNAAYINSDDQCKSAAQYSAEMVNHPHEKNDGPAIPAELDGLCSQLKQRLEEVAS